MGVGVNVGFSDFPDQSPDVGRRVVVCFHYDTANTIGGTIVRDDTQEPGLMILRLDDGRHVLGTECMYSYQTKGRP